MAVVSQATTIGGCTVVRSKKPSRHNASEDPVLRCMIHKPTRMQLRKARVVRMHIRRVEAVNPR